MTIAQQVNYAMTRASVCMSTLDPAGQLAVAESMQRVADALGDDTQIFGPSLWSDQSQWCQDLAGSNTALDQGRYWAFCRSWEEQIVNRLSELAGVLRARGCDSAAEVADSAAGAVAAESEAAENVTTPTEGAGGLTTAALVVGGVALLVLLARAAS